MGIIAIEQENDNLVIKFEYGYYYTPEMVKSILEKYGQLTYRCTFYVDKEKIDFTPSDCDYKVIIAKKENDYFKLDKDIFRIEHDFYINSNIKDLDESIFHIEKESLIQLTTELLNEDFYLEDNSNNEYNHNYIKISDYRKLIDTFPNKYELKMYLRKVVSGVLSNFFNTKNYKDRYEKYVNNRRKFIKTEQFKCDSKLIIEQSEAALEILEKMLSDESLSEEQWQKQIIDFILLLFPKYIYCFDKIRIKDTYGNTKQIDMLLVDANGYVDVIEIKKAFVGSPITDNNYYRKNYIPVRELSGTVSQIEKYLYCLSSNKMQNEKLINKKRPKELEKIEIKINNPKGIIIYGRSDKMNQDQLADFEIIKRNYRDVVDIITYDDILTRLKNTITYYQSI